MRYNFDMDGTIADFYGVEGWLDSLLNEDVAPYLNARPLINMSRLARRLNKIQRAGNEIVIISWGSKNGTPEYLRAIAEAKRRWLRKHLPSVQWNEIIIVAYGEPKQNLSHGILFDDEENNRNAWGNGAYEPEKIFQIMH